MNLSKLYWSLSDSWVISGRNIKHIFRNPESLLIGMGLPVMLMLLFVFIFGGAINTGTEYVNYVVPGIIIVCVGYTSSMVAVSVTQDMIGGLFRRLRSMPIQPSSFLISHVVASFIRNTISTSLIILVALLLGFRPSASWLEWLGVIALISLFLLSISWVSIIFGLLAKSIETASAFTFTIMFLPYISSAFVPTETMPAWLHAFADNQPLTPLIETLRGLLIGTPIGNSAWIAIAWFGAILLSSFVAAILIFNRRRREG